MITMNRRKKRPTERNGRSAIQVQNKIQSQCARKELVLILGLLDETGRGSFLSSVKEVMGDNQGRLP